MDTGINATGYLSVVSSADTKLSLVVLMVFSSILKNLYDMGSVLINLITKFMENKEVEEKTAEKKSKKFLEIVIAPS